MALLDRDLLRRLSIVALIPPLAFDASPQFREASPPQMPVAALIGRDTGPEPEPPATLS